MNTLTLTGNLTADPEFEDREHHPVCRMRIAVNNGRYPTTYIDVSAFDKQAYVCAEYLRKGRKVGVIGRLAFDEWRDGEGRKRSSYSVIGRVEFLDRPSDDLVEHPGLRDRGSSQSSLLEPVAE